MTHIGLQRRSRSKRTSAKCEVPFLTATAGMWMKCQTAKLWAGAHEYWAIWLLTMFLHSL